MALQINLDKSTIGVGFTQCYARIESFFGDKNRICFDVSLYANAQAAVDARLGKSREVESRRYEVPFAAKMGDNMLVYLYAQLKSASEFQGALDV